MNKCIKRFGCVGLIIALLISMTAIPSSASPDYGFNTSKISADTNLSVPASKVLFEENFNTNIDIPLTGSGNSTVGANNTIKIGNTEVGEQVFLNGLGSGRGLAGVSIKGDGSMTVDGSKNGGTNVYLQWTLSNFRSQTVTPFKGVYTTEFQFKAAGITGSNNYQLFYSHGLTKTGADYPGAQLNINKGLLTYNSAAMNNINSNIEIKNDVWYTVRVKQDTANATYSFWVNGVCGAKNAAMYTGYNNIWPEDAVKYNDRVFRCSAPSTGAMSFDYIKMYCEPFGRTTLYANDFSKYTEDVTYTTALNVDGGFTGLGLSTAGSNRNAELNAAENAWVFNKSGKMIVNGFKNLSNAAFAFDFSTSTPNATTNNIYVMSSGSAQYGAWIAMSGGNLILPITADNSNKVLIKGIEKDKAYRIVVHMDLSKTDNTKISGTYLRGKGTYDVFIDGVCKAAGIGILYPDSAAKYAESEAQTNIDRVLFVNPLSSSAQFQIKNVELYQDVREEIMALAAKDVEGAFGTDWKIGDRVNLPLIYTSDVGGDSNYSVAWTCSDTAVYNPLSGVVNKTAEPQNLRLTATVTDSNGDYGLKRYFDITIPEITDTDSIATDSDDIATVPGWVLAKGNPTAAENPTIDVDRSLKLTSGDEAYKTIDAHNGIFQVSADIYLSGNDAASAYLADSNGCKFAEAVFDKFTISNATANGNDVIAHVGYSENSWFSLKLVCDTLLRSFDIFVNNEKINSAPVPFIGNEDDNGALARIGFTGISGSVYVDNISLGYISEKTGLALRQIYYQDEMGERKTPSSGAALTKVELNNTRDGQTAAVYAAIYDENGRVTDVGKSNTKNLKTGINTVTINDVTVPQNWTDRYDIKVFAWENEQNLKPVLSDMDEVVNPTIYIAGDSMAADYKTQSYPYTGWGFALKDRINSEAAGIVNIAKENCTSGDFVSGCVDVLKNRITPQDYLLISFAYDDMLNNVSREDYENNIKTIAAEARRNGAQVIFVTAPSPQMADIDAYNAYASEAAAEINAPVLDLNASWSSFMASTSFERNFYASTVDAVQKNDYRWAISELNPESDNYNEESAGKDGHLSPAGAEKAAELLATLLKNSGLAVGNVIKELPTISYSVENGVMTVSGTGAMPIYAAFSQTPWSALADSVTEIRFSEGITTISSAAFSAFSNLVSVHIPESVTEIQAGAFPTSTEITMWGYYKSAAQRYAETAGNIKFALTKLRIMALGNSHTADYMQWRENIFNDLYDAGLKTTIEYTSGLVGASQMYFTDYGYSGETNIKKSHYLQGSNPNSPKYSTEPYCNLRNGKYDLILIQDFRESVMEKYADSFEGAMAKVMRWLRNEHPNADVAWVADWADIGSAQASSDRSKIKTQWETYGALMIAKVSSMTADRPDFIIPMGTALQNARTSYLGSVYNAADCYNNPNDTDWAGSNAIANHTVLERDTTHCSYELGRYLVGVAVFAKIFTQYNNILGGADNSFDFFGALKTKPVRGASTYPWYGEVTESAMNVICESAQNAFANPTAVTDSVYTKDPADTIADAVANLSYASLAAETVAMTVNNANLGISIDVSDVTVDKNDENKAVVTFLYGYTKKSVLINK